VREADEGRDRGRGRLTSRCRAELIPVPERNSFFGNGAAACWGMRQRRIQIAEPGRRVVAVIGDGSEMISITACGVRPTRSAGMIFVITKNEGYRSSRPP